MLTQSTLIGLGAGLAAALLQISAVSGGALATFLFYLTPLPLMIAGLGWGWMSALVGSLLAAVFVVMGTAPEAGLFFLFVTGVPSAWLSYLAYLSRPENPDDENSNPVFYPVGRLMVQTAAIGFLCTMIGVLMIAGGLEAFREQLRAAFDSMWSQIQSNPSINNDVDPAAIVELFVRLLPIIGAALWTLSTLLNFYVAARIARASGRLARPIPDMRDTDIPVTATYIFAVAIGLSFLPGLIGFAGQIGTAVLFVPHMLLGLAVVHTVAAKSAMKGILLGTTYALLVFTGWIAVVLVALGTAESIVGLRSRYQSPPSSGGPPGGMNGPDRLT
jgi:hypothetical protein